MREGEGERGEREGGREGKEGEGRRGKEEGERGGGGKKGEKGGERGGGKKGGERRGRKEERGRKGWKKGRRKEGDTYSSLLRVLTRTTHLSVPCLETSWIRLEPAVPTREHGVNTVSMGHKVDGPLGC